MDKNALRCYFLSMALILAPLAGYTDKAFREIAVRFGAEETVTEMVSAEGLARDSEKTRELLERFDGETNLTLQLFASKAEQIKRALSHFDTSSFKKIDINAGCPVAKVVKTGAGSALMNNASEAAEMIKTIKGETGLKVSIKFRLGWDENSINFLSFAETAANAGADELTLHARTRSQGYAGNARKEYFKELRRLFPKGDFSSPLLNASGDVFKAEDAISYFNEYEMDSVMFARGAIGNPFIFRETHVLLSGNEYDAPSKEERINTALEHLDLAIKYYGESLACREMRKSIPQYIKGLKDSSRVKAELSRCSTKDEYLKAFFLMNS